MWLRVTLLAMLAELAVLAAGSGSAPLPTDGEAEKLRQTGAAAGYVRDTPKDLLCERAEDQAWRNVWASCPRSKQVLDAVTSNCITTDYVVDRDSDHGPKLSVEVQVEYHCR